LQNIKELVAVDFNKKFVFGLCILFLFSFSSVYASITPDSLKNGLISYWKLDETSGTSFADSHINGLTGTGNNEAISGTAGKINNGADFTGGDYYIENTTLSVTYPFTISQWVKKTSWSAGGTQAFTYVQLGASFFAIAQVQGSWDNHIVIGAGSQKHWTFPYADNTNFNHYVVVVKAVNDYEGWVNGVKQNLTDRGGTFGGSSSGVQIGRSSNSGGGMYLNGLIDEVGIWNRTLNSTEISKIFEIQKDGYTNGSYPFTALGPISANFTITAKNEFNNATINTFNATIDGINYQTTTGSIVTHILANATSTYSVSIQAGQYYQDRTYTNFNVSSNLEAQMKPFIKFYAKNYWNNATIEIFNTSQTNIVYDDGGTYNILFSANNYFDKYYNITFDGTFDNYTAYLYQSEILFSATNIISNQSVNDFNITISGITKANTEPWYLATGTYNATFSKTGYYNQTQEITINALDNKTININNVYERILEVRATTKNGSSINNFSVTISLLNTAYAGYSSTLNTTNGLITFPVIDGNFNISIDAPGYELKDNTTITNTTINTYNFSLYTTNSILFKIYDEETGNLINQLVKLTLISDDFSYIFNTTNGTKYVDLLSPQTYMIFAESDGYPLRSYSFKLTDRTFNEFDIYMINDTTLNEIIATVYSEGYTRTLENAYIKVMKYFPEDNTYRLVETVKTNFEGVAILNLVKKTQYYKFIIEYPLGTVGFTSSPTFVVSDTLTFELKPTIARNYELYFDIEHTLTFNNATNNFRFDFNNEENLQFCLRLFEKIKGKEVLINQSCLTSQTGTILIGIEPQNNTGFIAKAFVSFDNGLTYTFLTNNIQDFYDVAEIDQKTAIGILIILTLTFMTIGVFFNGAYMLILTPLPMMFFIILGILHIPYGIGIGVVMMFLGVIGFVGDN
jgi:hypothetical protein